MSGHDGGSGAHAVCVVQNPRLKRTISRALHAAGYEVECLTNLSDLEGRTRLLFIDHDSREASSLAELLGSVTDSGSVVILGDSLEHDETVAILREQHVDHLIANDKQPEEAELLITSVKLLTGDIFGLDKYLPWGTRIHELEVKNYAEKRDALATVVAHARSMGARRALMARLEHVTDELLMNAIYDAPAVRRGISTKSRISALADGQPADFGGEKAVLRYGCDGRYFAVSATDPYGELRKEVILDHLVRARKERGAPKQDGPGGAGLGLYFVLSSATQFIVNIEPGQRTEVVCLFDLSVSGREMSSYAQSVHIFVADGDSAQSSDA